VNHDIAIIGAGLAGSSLAAALAERGWDVLLLERRQRPQHKVCGEFLSPESQGSLHVLGLYSAVAALDPHPMTRARLISPRGLRLSVELPGTAWGVSRFALDAALTGAAERAGACVQLGATATAVESGDALEHITVRDAHGQLATVRARAVVLACGRNPLPGLRPRIGAARARPTFVGVKCHYSGLALPPEVRLYLFGGGYAGLAPIEQGRANLCMLVPRTAFAQAGSSVSGMIAAALHANPVLERDLRGGAIVPGSEVAVAPVDTAQAGVPWDRFARLGDAAVMIPPLCGDGMAMALRGAELCAPLAHEFLRGDRTLESWEAAYRGAWHREFDRPVRVGRWLQGFLGMPGLGSALLGIGAILRPLPAWLVRATRASHHPLA
jgi:flavin-dependent dehydrogenase